MFETKIRFHPHASERMLERGVSKEDVGMTIERREQFSAKYCSTGFRRNFSCDGTWRGKRYGVKQIDIYAEKEDSEWLVVTVISRYF